MYQPQKPFPQVEDNVKWGECGGKLKLCEHYYNGDLTLSQLPNEMTRCLSHNNNELRKGERIPHAWVEGNVPPTHQGPEEWCQKKTEADDVVLARCNSSNLNRGAKRMRPQAARALRILGRQNTWRLNCAEKHGFP